MSDAHQFTKWFVRATNNEPYPFQIRFACEPELPELVDVPTGMGKTAMAVIESRRSRSQGAKQRRSIEVWNRR